MKTLKYNINNNMLQINLYNNDNKNIGISKEHYYYMVNFVGNETTTDDYIKYPSVSNISKGKLYSEEDLYTNAIIDGNNVHKMLENYFLDRDILDNLDNEPSEKALLRFNLLKDYYNKYYPNIKKDNAFIVEGRFIAEDITNGIGFGGTVDLFLTKDNEIIEHKSGKFYKEHLIQISAYAIAHGAKKATVTFFDNDNKVDCMSLNLTQIYDYYINKFVPSYKSVVSLISQEDEKLLLEISKEYIELDNIIKSCTTNQAELKKSIESILANNNIDKYKNKLANFSKKTDYYTLSLKKEINKQLQSEHPNWFTSTLKKGSLSVTINKKAKSD